MIKKQNFGLPSLCLGTFGMGNFYLDDKTFELNTLVKGVKHGFNMLDTAEIYGNGRSEKLVGKVIKFFERDKIKIVTKIHPKNCNKYNIFHSINNSLKRLNTEYIDLYLLHWRTEEPLKNVVDLMENLVKEGKILRWGVSNFDVEDMEEILKIKNGENCYANQVMYNIVSRGIEFDLIPFLNSNNILCMTYSPILNGRRIKRLQYNVDSCPVLNEISEKYKVSVNQILLNFTLRQNVLPVVRTSNYGHFLENIKAIDLKILEEDWAKVDDVYLKPASKMHLDMY